MARRSEGTDKAFATEKELVTKYRALIQEHKTGERCISVEEFQALNEELLKNYERILGDIKLLTSVGDRLQRKVKSANMMLEQQQNEIKAINSDLQQTNTELKLTIDELTRTRASRRARALVLFIAVGLFIVSELLEEVFEAQFAEGDVTGEIISWGFKAGLVFLIKPLEGYLERIMVKSAMDKEKRELLEKHTTESMEAPEPPQTATATEKPIEPGNVSA